jgi:predicted  nucleic acid-binding Zn-ribbon protein
MNKLKQFKIKMQSSYTSWKRAHLDKVKENPAAKQDRAPPMKDPLKKKETFEEYVTRTSKRNSRPPSEVGSIMSMRSMAAISERVTTLEVTLNEIKDELASQKEKTDETNKLLHQVLSRMT